MCAAAPGDGGKPEDLPAPFCFSVFLLLRFIFGKVIDSFRIEIMGACLTSAEKDIYIQVKCTLPSGRKAFSKRDLKCFVKWLFVNFPDISVLSVGMIKFWDTVEKHLHHKTKDGERDVLHFIRFCCSITDALEKRGVRRVKKKNRGSPVPSLPPSVSPCLPYTPSPLSSRHGACKVAEASDGASTVLKPPVSP